MTIAKREQSESGRDFSLHSNKKSSSIKDQQEYLVSALPNIGPSAAKALLEHFGSVSKIFSATESIRWALVRVPDSGIEASFRSETSNYR